MPYWPDETGYLEVRCNSSSSNTINPHSCRRHINPAHLLRTICFWRKHVPCGSRSLAQMSLLFGQVVRGVSAVGRVFEVIMSGDVLNQFDTSTCFIFIYALCRAGQARATYFRLRAR